MTYGSALANIIQVKSFQQKEEVLSNLFTTKLVSMNKMLELEKSNLKPVMVKNILS